MQKIAFMMKIQADRMDEYIRMHENIWPEMKNALKKAGRSNYSIWHAGNMVFGYYEVEDADSGSRILQESDVFIQWNEVIKEMLDPTDVQTQGGIQKMDMIFYLE